MSYLTVTTIVDGALHDERDFSDDEDSHPNVLRFLAEQERAAKSDGLPTEIFVLYHDHEPEAEGDCVCIQYVQDRRPIRAFNVTEEER